MCLSTQQKKEIFVMFDVIWTRRAQRGSTDWTADQLVQTRNEHMYVLFTRIRRI